MNVVWIETERLKPYENNAKKHPEEQIEHIANSLTEFGWKQPLVVDKDNCIVVGHGRWLAAKKLGQEAVPCLIADDLTEQKLRALRLVDNKTTESEWDADNLEFELAGFVDIDMSRFGFSAVEAVGGDWDRFFVDAEPKPAKRIECPNCGEWFEV